MDNEQDDQIWPPKPQPSRFNANNSEKTNGSETVSCPHCGRKLLSMRSILCNWCGKRIDDPEYQERAAEERAVEDAKLRDQVEKELDETARMGVIGRLKGQKKVQAARREHFLDLPPDRTKLGP